MKRILIFVLFITSLSLFSQSEIWGVKHFAGSDNGGILFSIDSASQKIEIQHRFLRYKLPYRGTSLLQIGSSNDYIGSTGDKIFKYNIENEDYISTNSFGTIRGEFIEDNQGNCYYRASNNGDTYSYKLDINTLEYEKASFNLDLNNAIINPQNNSEFLLWRKIYGSIEELTSVDFNTGEAHIIYEQGNTIYSRIGKMIVSGNKIYSLASTQINGKMSLFIDSYNLETDTYSEDFFYTNDSSEYSYGLNWLNGFVMDADGILYGAGKLIPNDDRFYMFSYNPLNSSFEILAPITEEIGNNLIGNLVIDGEQKIYGNCNEGGAHNLGSVFSYNIQTKQVDLIYSYLPESNFETKSGLCLSSNGNILGMSSSLDTNIHRHIYQINKEDFVYQNLKTISVNPNIYEGFYPTDFTQLNNGDIIGITSKGGDSFNPFHGSGTLYQFTPRTKEYKKLTNIIDLFPDAYGVSQLFTTGENKILGFYHSWTDERSFIFNPETQSLDYLSDWGNSTYSYANKWIRESESSLLRANNANGKLERYHIPTHEIEELYSYENSAIAQLILLDEENLLCQVRATDSAALMNFNIPAQEMSLVVNLKDYSGDYSGYDYSSINFNYIKTDDGLLVGEYIEELDYSKWDITYRKIVSLDLTTLEMKTLSSGNEKSSKRKYSFIADYYKNGDAFAVNICRHYGQDAGFLRQIDVTLDSIYNIKEFEMPSWIYELDAEEEEFGFRILKKLKSTKKPDFINELEEAKIKAFYANQTLVINSEEYIKQAEFSIFDMAGRQVSSFSRQGFTKTEFNVNLESGTYILQMNLANQTDAIKFVVSE